MEQSVYFVLTALRKEVGGMLDLCVLTQITIESPIDTRREHLKSFSIVKMPFILP